MRNRFLSVGLMLAATLAFGLPAQAAQGQEGAQKPQDEAVPVEGGAYPATPSAEREAQYEQEERSEEMKGAKKEGFESGPGMKSVNAALASLETRNGTRLGEATFNLFGDDVQVNVRLVNAKPGTYSVYLTNGCAVPSRAQLDSQDAKDRHFPVKLGEIKVGDTAMGDVTYHSDQWTIGQGKGLSVTGKTVVLTADKVDWGTQDVEQEAAPEQTGPGAYEAKEGAQEEHAEAKELKHSEKVMTSAMRGESPLACGRVQQAIEAEGNM